MTILVKHLGLVDYSSTYEAMRSFTQERDSDTPDEIWVLEHPPVFTLGLAGDAGNLHSPSNQIPLVQVDRGGEITYHGPGQKQRLFLARALYKRPSVLALDEATSHLDIANEYAVTQVLKQLSLTRLIKVQQLLIVVHLKYQTELEVNFL